MRATKALVIGIIVLVGAIWLASRYMHRPTETVEDELLPIDGSEGMATDCLDQLRKQGFGAVADAMVRSRKPCILLPGFLSDRTKPVRSRIGGQPNLPASVPWPTYKGKSMSFIAQVDLAELPQSAVAESLPHAGMLFFFYDAEQSTWGFDPKDVGSWAVIYSEEVPPQAALVAYPGDLLKEARFKAVPVLPGEGTSLPDVGNVLSGLSLTDEERDRVYDIFTQYGMDTGYPHQMFGYPMQIQGEMELECQLASHGLFCGDPSGYEDPRAVDLKSGAADWRLLLQVGSDSEAGMMWGDSGSLYYWIRDEDLRNRRFDKVWLILQCY